MKQKEILYGIIGLLGGIIITWLLAANAVNSQNRGMMKMMGMNMYQERRETIEIERDQGMGMGSSMTDMMGSLSGKSGDGFDLAFLDAMIVHHEGAIEMAKEARVNASHQEIKDLAENIILTQTSEINKMKEWKKMW